MAVLTVAAVAVIATGGAAAAAGGAAGVASGFASGGTAATVGSSVAAAAGGGAAAGAVGGAGVAAATGAGAASTFVGAGAGAAAGAASSAGYTSVVAGLATGPVGWCVLGADGKWYTLDCWKPVLRDDSKELSNGRFLKDIVTDLRVKDVTVFYGEKDCYMIQNIWGEHFVINFLELPSGQVAAHASEFKMLPLMFK